MKGNQLPEGVYLAPSKTCMICGAEAECIDVEYQLHAAECESQ